MQAKIIFHYYVRQLGLVTRRQKDLLTFALAAAMHAAGHAAVALITGSMAAVLAQTWGPRAARSGTPWFAGPASDEAFLLSAVGLAAVFVKGAAGVYATYVQARIAGEVGGRLRLSLLDALLALHRLRRPRHGDHGEGSGANQEDGLAGHASALAVAALTERVHEVEVGLKQGFLGGARAFAQLVPLAAVLVWLSPRMAAVAALVLGVFGAALGRWRSGYQRASRVAGRERAMLLEAADESVRHADLWVTYGAEEKARSTVRTLGESLARGAARLEARAAALSGANEVLGAAALVVAVAAYRWGWLGGVADGGTLLGFAVAFFLVYRPLRELADARLALERAAGACGDLMGVIDAGAAGGRDPEPAHELAPPVARSWPLAVLELRGLRMLRGAIDPVSLRIEPGTIVAIVGPTGAGKTTLFRTLLGLEQPAGGDVLFDGVSLGGAPAGPAERPFAWVPQEAPLLADSLSANVSLGASVADPRAALEPLGAAHLADALGGARLGAGGRAVSGGERQWIALARAIATELPVLLLDEPTSGLDARAQGQVLDAVARLRGRRTVLIVTHRPEPLAIADVVVRLGPDAGWERAA